MRLARLVVLVFAVAFGSPRVDVAHARGPDPAERGLDLFLHTTRTVIAGDSLAVDVIGYGFATVTTARPLASARVTAAWDPESLGPGVAAAPKEVEATTDALGRARLDVPVPAGDAQRLALLVAIRHGEHVRTRKVDVARRAREQLEIRLPDPSVVPGSEVPAWVTVTDAGTGLPVHGAALDVTLLEGNVDRTTAHVTTDASGLARASVFVPPNASGSPPLSIRARLGSGSTSPLETAVHLQLRDERPATPHLLVQWKELQLKPGETGHAEIRVLDAADEPIAGHRVLTWAGPKGTTPPATDDAWTKSGTAAVTDGLGGVTLEAHAPRVVTTLGSDLTVVVRTEIEGQKLEEKRSVAVGQPVATAELTVESGALVPGVLQRAWIHVTDGDAPVAGDFVVEADGLKARIATDADGDAELTWKVPEDVGAARSVGPCAGGVAASVVVRQARPVPALSRHPEPFELCVDVARERATLLQTSAQVARVGDKVKASVVGAPRAARGAGSLVMTSPDGSGGAFWTGAGSGVAEIDLAGATPGIHELTLAVPRETKEAETTTARLLVVPRVLPKVAGNVAGGRIAPGGEAEIDVVLDDGHGAPITGSVTAVVVDREGGGSVAGLFRLDARRSLCDGVGVPRERCDAFLEGDPTAETRRRQSILAWSGAPLAPRLDPAAHTTEALNKTFRDVLHSLEGAVYQAQTPETLRDVRRKENGRWIFNPELMTLVTAAMSDPPTTPGGEPFGLGDLLAVDPQVTFDNVARRVTRLKLFTVLAAVRSFRTAEQIDADEPMLSDPNALLRRLVRDATLTSDALLDPWGGTIQFVRAAGPAVPFLTAARGFALHAPGPDGRIGTGDDVHDPFERVVRSATPYATAMGEDEIVDARWNMKVADATVSGWQEMFARLTGTALGSSSGSGSGEGFGSGNGRLGGAHGAKSPSVRSGSAIVTETARWTEPVRTDARGRVRLRVPLGDYETTWRVALLARTDAAQSAVATLDVPTFLPVSARVDAGRKLTLGDEIAARIVVRNRTASAKSVTIEVLAEGGLAPAPGEPRIVTVDVPPNAVRSVFSRVVAAREGKGIVAVTLRAPGVPGDRTVHDVTIEPPGEPRVMMTTAFVTGRSTLRVEVPPGYALRGDARVVFEGGYEDALIAALGAIEPEPGSPPEALADAVEVGTRIGKLAEAQGKHWLVLRSRKLVALAEAHLREYGKGESAGARGRLALQRAAIVTSSTTNAAAPVRKNKPDAPSPACPTEADLASAPVAAFLEAEPPPAAEGPLACFTSLVGKADTRTPLDLARATLALFDRPHRAPLAATLARELARVTRADDRGGPAFDGTRAERVVVHAALSRTAHGWSKDARAAQRLLESILALRDARGGYGSSEATRAAVRAIVGAESTPSRAVRVTIADGKRRRVVDVPERGTAVVALGPQTREIDVEVLAGRILARLERPVLRGFAGPPDATIAPVAVTAEWPNEARAGTTGIVHLGYRNALGRNASLWTRVPLPPGVELAAPVKNATLRQGVVHVRLTIGSEDTLSLPVRFTLPGRMLVPEAETRTVSEEQPHARTPARSLVVR